MRVIQVKVMQDNISGRGLDIPLLGLREGVSVSDAMRDMTMIMIMMMMRVVTIIMMMRDDDDVG